MQALWPDRPCLKRYQTTRGVRRTRALYLRHAFDLVRATESRRFDPCRRAAKMLAVGIIKAVPPALK